MMDGKNWMEIVDEREQITAVMEANSYTERFGITLSEEEARELLAEKNFSLKEMKRVEFGKSILPELIRKFCDSDYIRRENYMETIIRLQEIFYLYKNETMDKVTDEELLNLMREQFETVCGGDLDYLESTCLAVQARSVREGSRYDG